MDIILGFLMQSKNSRHFDAERFNLAQLLLKTPFFLSIIYIGDKILSLTARKEIKWSKALV